MSFPCILMSLPHTFMSTNPFACRRPEILAGNALCGEEVKSCSPASGWLRQLRAKMVLPVQGSLAG